MQKLNITRPHSLCQVLREGDSDIIDAEDLVHGDILLFGSGDRIAADIRVLGEHDLEVDESLLTGESQAVKPP